MIRSTIQETIIWAYTLCTIVKSIFKEHYMSSCDMFSCDMSSCDMFSCDMSSWEDRLYTIKPVFKGQSHDKTYIYSVQSTCITKCNLFVDGHHFPMSSNFQWIYTPQKKLRIFFCLGYFLLFEICHYNLIKNTPQKNNILNFFWGVYIYIVTLCGIVI